MSDIIVIGKNDALKFTYPNEEVQEKVQEVIDDAFKKDVDPILVIITIESTVMNRNVRDSLVEALKSQKEKLSDRGVNLLVLPSGSEITVYRKEKDDATY